MATGTARRKRARREPVGRGGDAELTAIELVAELCRLAAELRREADLERSLATALGVESCRIVARRDGDWIPLSVPSLGGDETPPAGPARHELVELGGDERLGLRLAPAPLAPRVRAVALALGRQIEQARSAARALARARARELHLGAALDRLALGVLYVDVDGVVLLANRAAREQLASVARLGVRGRPLRFRAPEIASRFEEFLAGLRQGPASARPGVSGPWQLARGSGRAPIELLAFALADAEDAPAASAALIFVSDPESAAATPAAVLAAHYRLTRSEARLAAEILRGGSLDEIAARIGVSRETARTHLRHLFAKMGTTRRADLVRLLLAGPAGLRWD